MGEKAGQLGGRNLDNGVRNEVLKKDSGKDKERGIEKLEMN